MFKEALVFDDVLLVPRYSEIKSRTLPDISSIVAGITLKVPIISSPMDGVTDAKMAIKVGEMGGMGIIHRFMTPEEQISELCTIKIEREFSGKEIPIVFAVGVGDEEFSRFKKVINYVKADAVAIDIANGHSILMKEMIGRIKDYSPSINIIAGNVATAAGFKYLSEAGANAVRIGIGGGCFVPGSMVMTSNGYRAIETILIGDIVLTHTGRWKKVIDIMNYYRDEEIISINDIRCTKNHEFYVVKKTDASLITEDNIHNYAFWIDAESLNEDEHLLIELD